MNKYQYLVQKQFLNNEAEVLERLRAVYSRAQKDVNDKIEKLQFNIDGLTDIWEDFSGEDEEKEILKSRIQSKIYQKQYQEVLKKQIDNALKDLQNNSYKTISEYLVKCYEDGFIGTLFDLQGQGVPLIMPIDQEQMVRAVQLDSKISQGLYTRMGEDVVTLKNHIMSEVSRGISNGFSFAQVAQQISFKMTGTKYKDGGALSNAMRIARTEGHRIQCQSAMDACYKARDMGADVVKQWDSTLDRKTRESHQHVDGEIRELEEPFSNSLMFPGDPSGGAAEVVNCRCALLEKGRWLLDVDETKYLGDVKQMTDEQKEQIANKLKIPVEELEQYSKQIVPISAKDYDDFKRQYKKIWNYEGSDLQKEVEARIGTESAQKISNATKNIEQFERYKKVLGKNCPKTLEEFNKIKYNNPEKWDELKYQYRTVNRYEVNGSVSADQIVELDNAAYYTKKKGFDYSGFSGKEKRKITNSISNCGNVAVMELDGKVYFSHSKFDVSGSFEHSLYKGEYSAVTLSENRIFKVKDLGDGVPRQYDTEAKFLEFVAKQKKTTDNFVVTILSEKHICESCQSVVKQFKEIYPNATVNIVSGKKGYNGSPEGLHTWKRRKRVE